jgi:hypothetical protein
VIAGNIDLDETVAPHSTGTIAEGHTNENDEVGGVGPNGLPDAPDRNRLYLKPA